MLIKSAWNMKLLKLLSLAVILAFISISCQPLEDLDKLDEASYDAEYAVPIANAQLSLRKALEKADDLNAIYIDDEGIIHFQYSGDLITQSSEDIFESINGEISGTPIPLLSKNMPVPLGDESGFNIDRLLFKEGTLAWLGGNPFEEQVTVTVSVPQISKDGEIFSVTQTVSAAPSQGEVQNFVGFGDLTGYEVIPDPVTDSIYLQYEFIRANGEPDFASFLVATFNELEFSYMEGYMGVESHKGKDTIIIDFFDSYVKGDIYFANPTVTFDVENAFGIPTRSKVNIFEVFTVRDETLNLSGEYIDNGIDFPYPELDQVGVLEFGEFIFDKNNSNIDSILGSGPLAIHYDVDAITNPDMDTSIRGFITDSSYYKVKVEVDLPLYGNAVDFIARDTFDLNFDNYGEVDNMELKMITENELPLDVLVQGYMVDAKGEVLDSLFSEQSLVIESAVVDLQGFPSATTEKINFIEFTADKFERIRDTEQLILVASFYTTDEGTKSVYITESQNLNVRIGAKIGISNE
jgi:hypothetical protein